MENKREKESSRESILQFNGYYVKEINFKYNESHDVKKVTLDFDFYKNIVKTKNIEEENQDLFLVTLGAKIFQDSLEKDYPFEMSVEIVGEFILESEDDEINESNVFFNVNAIAILFPYLRAIVTTYSSLANVAPLILPPMNIVEWFNDKNKSETRN